MRSRLTAVGGGSASLLLLASTFALSACEARTAITDPEPSITETGNRNASQPSEAATAMPGPSVTPVAQADAAPAPPAVVRDNQTPDAGTAIPASDYAVWCRHYCETLAEGNLYFCIAEHQDALACALDISSADLCEHDRCAPKLVPPSLCPTQCDVLRRAYDAVCSGRPIPSDNCPVSPDDHHRACRAGCPTSTEG